MASLRLEAGLRGLRRGARKRVRRRRVGDRGAGAVRAVHRRDAVARDARAHGDRGSGAWSSTTTRCSCASISSRTSSCGLCRGPSRTRGVSGKPRGLTMVGSSRAFATRGSRASRGSSPIDGLREGERCVGEDQGEAGGCAGAPTALCVGVPEARGEGAEVAGDETPGASWSGRRPDAFGRAPLGRSIEGVEGPAHVPARLVSAGPASSLEARGLPQGCGEPRAAPGRGRAGCWPSRIAAADPFRNA